MHTLSAMPIFSRRFANRPTLLLASALLLAVSMAQAVPTGLLNDTGQTQCADDNNALVACDSATTGDAGTRPRQDGRFGRDAAAPAKVGGGAAGFDFTPLDASGNTIALTGSPAVPAATPRCVKDNVTNLIWEVKTNSGLQDTSYRYAWGNNAGGATCGGTVSPCNTDAFIAALNAADLCGETANDWRLPTGHELRSIVNAGRTTYPMIDTNFFPATQSNWYWTSQPHSLGPVSAWMIEFGGGFTGGGSVGAFNFVRLVRSGP